MGVAFFLARKIFSSVILIIFSITLIYFLVRLIPGDPITILYGEMRVDENTKKTLEEKLGLNKPLHIQVALFISRIFLGDWGKSIYTNDSVLSIIIARLWNSFKLAILSTIILFLACIGLGYIELVFFKNSRSRGLLTSATTLTSYIPTIIWSSIVLLVLILLRLPMIHGHLIPPLIALTIAGLGIMYKIYRESILYALNQPFIQTYVALGYSRARLYSKVIRYAFPIFISAFLYRLGLILAGSIAIETMFTYPGMGHLFTIAFASRDYPLLIGWGVSVTMVFVTVYTLIDILHALFDPRVRIV